MHPTNYLFLSIVYRILALQQNAGLSGHKTVRNGIAVNQGVAGI
jgi:hypothetical protein